MVWFMSHLEGSCPSCCSSRDISSSLTPELLLTGPFGDFLNTLGATHSPPRPPVTVPGQKMSEPRGPSPHCLLKCMWSNAHVCCACMNVCASMITYMSVSCIHYMHNCACMNCACTSVTVRVYKCVLTPIHVYMYLHMCSLVCKCECVCYGCERRDREGPPGVTPAGSRAGCQLCNILYAPSCGQQGYPGGRSHSWASPWAQQVMLGACL